MLPVFSKSNLDEDFQDYLERARTWHQMTVTAQVGLGANNYTETVNTVISSTSTALSMVLRLYELSSGSDDDWNEYCFDSDQVSLSAYKSALNRSMLVNGF